MKKRILVGMAGVVLGLLVLPVLIVQLTRAEPRQLHGVTLEETDYQEVSFHNRTQGLQLAGMLFIPEGEGPFPAAVLIHGNGTSRRSNSWYLTLAHSLQQNGVAVLLPDKRGSEKSEGDWRTSSYEDLATDTAAAVEFLRGYEGAEFSSVGIVGLSQGGHFSPVVADLTEIDFLVDVVGTSLPAYEVLIYEEDNNLQEMGVLPGLSKLVAYASTYYLRTFAQPEFWGAVGNFDPLPYWEELTVPAFVLYGGADTNVPAERSAARLEALGKENLTVKIYPGSGHALEDPEGVGNRLWREDALRDIREFVLKGR